MRFAPLALLLCLAACAPPPGSSRPAPVDPVVSARADSLLALPPDSLSAADTAWLQAYAVRRQPERRDPQRSSTSRIVGGILAGALVIGVVVTVVNAWN